MDSEGFLLEIASRSPPGDLPLGKLVREIIDNSRYLEKIPRGSHPLSPTWEQVKTALERRNDRLYQELDRKEQRYQFGKDEGF